MDTTDNRKYRKSNKEQILKKREEYYLKNKNKITQSKRRYYEKNKDEIRKQKKIRYLNNRDELLKRQKAYYRKKRDERIEYHKEYYKKNRGQILLGVASYREKNREIIRRSQKNYRKRYPDKIKERSKKYYESLAPYESFASSLTIDEAPIADNDGLLLVKCTYCGRYYCPKRQEVVDRIKVVEGSKTGEGRLYCSDHCKTACPTYKKIKYPRGHQTATSREVQPELRQMRLACDEYSCQRCGKTIDDAQLHCHHIEGVEQNPIESADLDNTITLCKKCHKWVHTQEGCRYFELRCE